MKSLAMALGTLAFYTLCQILMGKTLPWFRLFLLPLFLLSFKARGQFRDLWWKIRAAPAWVVKATFGLALVLFLARVGHFAYRMNGSTEHIEDIAIVHLKAINHWWEEGKNPYSTPIDSYTLVNRQNQIKVYEGFKYPPLQIFYYGPFVRWWGLRGIYAGNFLLYLLLILTLHRILRKHSPLQAHLGVIAFLTTDFVFTLAFNKGTNDFLPTLLVFWTILCLREKKDKTAGLLLGASLLAKQLPGGLLLLWMATQKKGRAVLIGSLLFVLGQLPFVLWHPQSYWENVWEFHLLRPVRETSLLVHLPSFWQSFIPLAGLCLCLGLSFLGHRWKDLRLDQGWTLPTLGFTLFLITAKMSPSHYFVWVIPFFILWTLSPPQAETVTSG